MIKMKTKNLKALTKLATKDDIRFYANGVCFHGETQTAVVSDALTLVSVPCELPKDEETIVKKQSLETQVKIASAKKDVELAVETEESIYGKYPPFQSAFPRSVDFEVSFDVKNLKKVVDAMAAMNTLPNNKVTLKFENADRPMLIENEEGVKGLIVPLKND